MLDPDHYAVRRNGAYQIYDGYGTSAGTGILGRVHSNLDDPDDVIVLGGRAAEDGSEALTVNGVMMEMIPVDLDLVAALNGAEHGAAGDAGRIEPAFTAATGRNVVPCGMAIDCPAPS
jgi:hypothetical protein